MNFTAITEGILSQQDNTWNNIVMPLIPSKNLDLSEFFTFKITPHSDGNNITSPRRAFPFLKGKADPTPSEEDRVEPFIYGEEITSAEALSYARKTASAISSRSKRLSTTKAIEKIFREIDRVSGVFYVLRTPKDTTFIFRVDTAFLRVKRIHKDLEGADTTGFEDLL